MITPAVEKAETSVNTSFAQLSNHQTGRPVCLAEGQVKTVRVLRSFQTYPAYCFPSRIASVGSLHQYFRDISDGEISPLQ